ncbi:nucleotidyltransferase family protein [Andreprevotia lacus]|nr:nucleotidyltransferase family protein [Andreprevotia lacus]
MSEAVFLPQLASWLRSDTHRWAALQHAAALGLPDWCIAAGFVRNLAWDKLHGHAENTPLADIDLIYFDAADCSSERDHVLEAALTRSAPQYDWSVKNQARMHLRNHDAPYRDSVDAMSYWVSEEDAVAVRLEADGSLRWLGAFGIDKLQLLQITLNHKRPKHDDFERRIRDKGWLQRWPLLRVVR